MLKKLSNKLSEYPGIYTFLRKIIENNFKAQRKVISQEVSGVNGKILDVPCGIGEFSVFFDKKNYVGVDLSKIYVDYAKRKYGKIFVVGDALNLVFDDDLDGGPEKIRIETDKNADGVITQFKMDACNGDGEVNETIVQTINPATGAFDSNITHVYSDTNEGFSFTGSSQVDVDGTVNGNGNFEGTKEIIMSYTQSWTAGSNEGEDNGSMTLN